MAGDRQLGDPRLYPQPAGAPAVGQDNPGGTVPYGAVDPRFRPVGYWANSNWVGLNWSVGEGPVLFTATWGSPVFDLRTDVRSASSVDNRAIPMNRTSGAQLFVAIKGLSSNHLGLNVYALQSAHPVFAKELIPVAAAADCTAQLSTGTDGALLTFFPPSSGYPVRFWQLTLRFDWVLAGGSIPSPLPRIAVQGAMY